jgi:hypothetical protein
VVAVVVVVVMVVVVQNRSDGSGGAATVAYKGKQRENDGNGLNTHQSNQPSSCARDRQ